MTHTCRKVVVGTHTCREVVVGTRTCTGVVEVIHIYKEG